MTTYRYGTQNLSDELEQWGLDNCPKEFTYKTIQDILHVLTEAGLTYSLQEQEPHPKYEDTTLQWILVTDPESSQNIRTRFFLENYVLCEPDLWCVHPDREVFEYRNVFWDEGFSWDSDVNTGFFWDDNNPIVSQKLCEAIGIFAYKPLPEPLVTLPTVPWEQHDENCCTCECELPFIAFLSEIPTIAGPLIDQLQQLITAAHDAAVSEDKEKS